MDIKVIRHKEVITTEDLLDIRGGLNESLDFIATQCTCNCFTSNSNSQPEKPSRPSTSIKG